MHEQLETSISCPYCGESIEILIDLSCNSQQYYEDCSVCCAPIFITAEIDGSGKLENLVIKRDDD